MRKFLVTLIMCLSSSVIYAANTNSYLLLTGGIGSGFSIVSKGKSCFAYTKPGFGGMGYQRPFRSSTLLEGVILGSGKAEEAPSDYTFVQTVSRSVQAEGVAKKPLLKIKLSKNASLKPYLKGGVWCSSAYLNYARGGKLIFDGGILGGGGVQTTLFSNYLLDISGNYLISLSPEGKNTWYFRVGIGRRFN